MGFKYTNWRGDFLLGYFDGHTPQYQVLIQEEYPQ